MAAKKPDLTVKNGIFWRKFGIQRVNAADSHILSLNLLNPLILPRLYGHSNQLCSSFPC